MAVSQRSSSDSAAIRSDPACDPFRRYPASSDTAIRQQFSHSASRGDPVIQLSSYPLATLLAIQRHQDPAIQWLWRSGNAATRKAATIQQRSQYPASSVHRFGSYPATIQRSRFSSGPCRRYPAFSDASIHQRSSVTAIPLSSDPCLRNPVSSAEWRSRRGPAIQ